MVFCFFYKNFFGMEVTLFLLPAGARGIARQKAVYLSQKI